MKVKGIDSQVPYYYIYRGASMVCCYGRIQCGYNVLQFLMTFTALNGTHIYYYLALKPTIIPLILLALNDILMLITTLTNPGVIPRIVE